MNEIFILYIYRKQYTSNNIVISYPG